MSDLRAWVQSDTNLQVMNARLNGEVERLQARESELKEEIANLEDRLISQGQMLREIVTITKGLPVDKMHSTHDAVASVARLKAISDNAIRAMENL